jgi:hypothetical protein
MDRTTRRWHKAIIADAERVIGRNLTNDETYFITSRGGYIALEMIHDTIKAGTKEEIVSYLNSEVKASSNTYKDSPRQE